MLSDFIKSLLAYLEALRYFVKFSLYKHLIFLLVLLILFAFPVFIFDYIVNALTRLIPYFEMQKYAMISVNMAAGISGFLLLLILSPLFSTVSEEVGKRLSDHTYKFSFLQFMKDIVRGLKISLRNLIYQYFMLALISIFLFLMPKSSVLQFVGNSLIFLITAYFYGFSILDYAMENYRMSYKASVNFVHQNPGIALGLGSVYYLAISANNVVEGSLISHHTAIYWSAFSEALVALIGVIAASIVMHRKQSGLLKK